jgi:hypothetical protein
MLGEVTILPIVFKWWMGLGVIKGRGLKVLAVLL